MSYGCSETGDRSGFRGCGREFGSLRDFDRHWVGLTVSDDPARNRAIVHIGGGRCATDEELRNRGMVLDYRNVWHDAASLADVATRLRPKGSTETVPAAGSAPDGEDPGWAVGGGTS